MGGAWVGAMVRINLTVLARTAARKGEEEGGRRKGEEEGGRGRRKGEEGGGRGRERRKGVEEGVQRM